MNIKIRLTFTLVVGTLVLAFCLNAGAQTSTRIRFAKSATRANVTGTLNGYRDEKIYVIRVRGGQTLRTEQIGIGRLNHHITIYVENPDGEEVGDSDASCNNRREITPTEPGDYHLRIVECKKADRWRGRFSFRVTVN